MLSDPYNNDVFITTLQPTPKNIIDFSKNLGRTLNWISKIPEKKKQSKTPTKASLNIAKKQRSSLTRRSGEKDFEVKYHVIHPEIKQSPVK